MARRPIFTPFAKAQAFGLAVGFALALWAADRLSLSPRGFALAALAAWVAWEFLLGPRAPSARSDARALSYALLSGFAFPWVGLALVALIAAIRP